jgi:hypothetical protein
VSGYSSQKEVRDVIRQTLVAEGRDPADYNITGILRDAFHYRGRHYGYGALTATEWDAAVTKHRRRNRS